MRIRDLKEPDIFCYFSGYKTDKLLYVKKIASKSEKEIFVEAAVVLKVSDDGSFGIERMNNLTFNIELEYQNVSFINQIKKEVLIDAIFTHVAQSGTWKQKIWSPEMYF